MDPVTSLAVKAATSWAVRQFKTYVIDPWSKRRAEAFFDTFVKEVSSADQQAKPLSDLEPLLSKILESESKSEVLFDAYRRVCLSASPTLGPRVIAVITARIINENRTATPEEERTMMVVKQMSDVDLVNFQQYLDENKLDEHGAIRLFEEHEDSNWKGGDIPIGSVSLGDNVGNWCLKLANAGLVTQDVFRRSRDYGADSERHIDEPGTLTTYTWKLTFFSAALDLKDIVKSLREGTDDIRAD